MRGPCRTAIFRIEMLKLENIVGAATEPSIADRLHDLGHHGRVEYLTLSQEDTHRHRLRAATDAGTECAVILDRTEHLYNGAVLMLTDERAVVVRMRETEWLTLAPRDTSAALELGTRRRCHSRRGQIAGVSSADDSRLRSHLGVR